MSIDPLNLVRDIVTKGPGIAGPHNRAWATQHGHPHGGDGVRGFPPNGGGPAHGGGPPRDVGDIGRGMPGFVGNERAGPGVDRANPGNIGNGNVDRPHVGNGNAGNGGIGPGHPGQGAGSGTLSEALGLPRQVLNAPAGHPHGHPPGHAVSQHAQLAAPAQGSMQGQASHAGLQGAPLAQAGAPMQSMQAHAQPPPSQQVAQPSSASQAHVAQPARADSPPALSPRTEAAPLARADAAAERMAMLQRAPAAPMALATTTGPAAIQASAAALAAAGTTMATAPAAPAAALATTQAGEARNVNPLVAGDRGHAIARPDGTGTYTGEGPQRRGLRRSMRTLPGGLATLFTALGAQGHTGAGGRDLRTVERELREAMLQWLFWLLAIIAYGCVAFALIGLMPSGSFGGIVSGIGSTGGRAWAGGFAVAGLIAGAAAWWFARGIARGGRGKT
jgi:hypothetical protein